jgi:4-hydroxy-tetrahydrodipicolinate synthase
LAEIKNIVGIKEASGSITQVAQVISLCPQDFIVLSGDDNMVLPLLSLGGQGVISVVANLVPIEVHQLIASWEKGEFERARKKFYHLLPLSQAMFYETNPIPVKTALNLMGMIEPELRLPLFSISPANLNRLKNVLEKYGLIKDR